MKVQLAMLMFIMCQHSLYAAQPAESKARGAKKAMPAVEIKQTKNQPCAPIPALLAAALGRYGGAWKAAQKTAN